MNPMWSPRYRHAVGADARAARHRTRPCASCRVPDTHPADLVLVTAPTIVYTCTQIRGGHITGTREQRWRHGGDPPA